MAIAAGVIVCTLSIVRGFHGHSFMGRPLGGDFVQFYVAGDILNQYDHAHLYDLDLEVRLQHESVPNTPKDQMLVFASAPVTGQVYRPFGLLSYPWAYTAWLIFSLGVYTGAVLMLIHSAGLSAVQLKTGLLLAISSMPFLMETWIGGQISVLAFLVISIFVYCRVHNREFFSGVALGLAFFKPTLVAIPVVMLVCGRRWKMLGGVITGIAALGVASIATVGIKGCVAWIDTLRFYGKLATGPASAFRRTKYVDLGSFFHLILGNASSVAQVLAALAAMAGLAVLGIAWWRSPKWSASSQDLLWAATIAGSLVLNVYTPIYDTILAGIAVALAAKGIASRTRSQREAFSGWIVLLYIVPWVTQSFAEFLRMQPFTLVLAGFAWWALESAGGADSATLQTPEPIDLAKHDHQQEKSPDHPVVRRASYALCCITSNSSRCLSVFLRSYSCAWALTWERDR